MYQAMIKILGQSFSMNTENYSRDFKLKVCNECIIFSLLLQDVIDETELLLAQKKRLENALRATEVPLHIATDNLNCRQRRQGLDLVQDDVEISLLKVDPSK